MYDAALERSTVLMEKGIAVRVQRAETTRIGILTQVLGVLTAGWFLSRHPGVGGMAGAAAGIGLLLASRWLSLVWVCGDCGARLEDEGQLLCIGCGRRLTSQNR